MFQPNGLFVITFRIALKYDLRARKELWARGRKYSLEECLTHGWDCSIYEGKSVVVQLTSMKVNLTSSN